MNGFLSKIKLCLLKITLVSMGLFVSAQALSADVWTYNNKVAKLQILSSGNFVIRLTAAADAVCQGGGTLFHVYVNENTVDATGSKALLSAAMTAFAADKSLDIRYDNGTSGCFVRELILNQ